MIDTLFVFTEEPSAKIVFDNILPRILPSNFEYRIFAHQGKQDLEKAIKTAIPTISKIPGAKILVTIDQDNLDCIFVKNKLNALIKSNIHCDYYIRIVCRELESWFLGDLKAIQTAYPRFKSEHYYNKAKYKNVDKISVPNKELLKIIPEYNNRSSLPKIETSEKISPFLDLSQNTSISFLQTVSAIEKLCNQ